MIIFTICDPDIIVQNGGPWLVVHPDDPEAVLATCDSEAEAKRARDAINDMPRVLRGVGETVK